MIARTTLGRCVAVVLSIVISQIAAPAAQAAQAVSPASHVVDSQQVATRLAERAAEREAQVDLVRSVLDTAEAQKQARVMGLSIDKMRGSVSHLSDSELKDLSQRAERVKDVAAAGHRGGDDGLVILAVILLVAGLAVLVAAGGGYNDPYYDECYCY